MSFSCPLSFVQIESNVSRISSFFVASLIAAYLISFNIFILYFVAADFIIRLFFNKNISPIYMLALFVKNTLKINDKFVDSGAKRLAAYFGLTFVILLIGTHFFHSSTSSFVIAGVFMFCSLLDALFNYCLGCKIYFIIKKIFPAFMS